MPGMPSRREAMCPGSQQGSRPKRPMVATALRWMIRPQMTVLTEIAGADNLYECTGAIRALEEELADAYRVGDCLRPPHLPSGRSNPGW